MSLCLAFCMDSLDLEAGEEPRPPCTSEATHLSCVPFIGVPTCAEHKCRCAMTIERANAIKAMTPNHWNAL